MSTKIVEWFILLAIFCAINLTGNVIGYGSSFDEAAIGLLMLLGLTLLGMIAAEVIPFPMPSIGYISLFALIVTLPSVPFSETFVYYTGKISLLSITTPCLAYAGISIGRNWADFRRLGWRAMVVCLAVFLGTYLGSAIIAEIVLRFQGLV
ncbi:hypothetical protein [Basilea psittacipulmonis]|uniref:Membrane protein n=1 Tax=Basilea psittacipulmonis DSM 24701 TaxID=1072685 RepID=A0A077DGM0_9BURK|nr:hypothetical protein [Basilea psittacipulmonis]AIL33281.1 membrane protein [Basilea psittacipulmonis DSM 24701]